MKKFAISIASLAIALSACGDVEENNNETNNEQVEEEPEANLAENEDENNNNGMDSDLNNDTDNGMDNNGSADMNSDEETEAVMDQDFDHFELNVTLVDDTEWNFMYSPSDDEASVSGDDLDLEGQAAVDEMEIYLADFRVNAASEQDEILSELTTFDFRESDIQEFDLTINFTEQENETEWTWSQDEGEGNDEQQDDEENNDNE
ncbi:YusW family protein [Salipaludibacillus daqingensis]|uniref:YusW family protein n=1 Tax=Salipaludibacillus daqingensis TaxID=3041001 RepID=UPI002473305F|nr:YusW family protein [Salipaludibacillus daqingensis]